MKCDWSKMLPKKNIIVTENEHLLGLQKYQPASIYMFGLFTICKIRLISFVHHGFIEPSESIRRSPGCKEQINPDWPGYPLLRSPITWIVRDSRNFPLFCFRQRFTSLSIAFSGFRNFILSVTRNYIWRDLDIFPIYSFYKLSPKRLDS